MKLYIHSPREQDFSQSRQLVLGQQFFQHGIGSLAEKSQHAILKNYYCPNPSCQEINLGNFVADIADETGVTEIQTRGFGSMRKKLSFFLMNYPVRVVYPCSQIKWLIRFDPKTGEVLSRRKSPKRSVVLELFRELYSIRELLWPENFSIVIPLLECEEYRIVDSEPKPFSKGYQKYELLPLSILGEIHLRRPEDLLFLLPENLPTQFTSSDLKKLAKTTDRTAFYTISVLRSLGLIRQVGKQGRSYLYEINILPEKGLP